MQLVDVDDVPSLTEAIRRMLQTNTKEYTAPPSFPDWSDQAALLTRVLGLHEEGFSVDWLRMREPHDHCARSIGLANAFAAAMGEGSSTVMEMACGLGSGTRFLSRILQADVEWLLVDHDPQLLAAVSKDMENTTVRYRTHQHDLRDLGGLDVSVHGVTTQALLDLVSHDWLVQLADWLADRRIPLLAALSVDGRVDWTPHDPRDKFTMRFVPLTWDRGFGPSQAPAQQPCCAPWRNAASRSAGLAHSPH